MSSDSPAIEVAEEALESKLDSLSIQDNKEDTPKKEKPKQKVARFRRTLLSEEEFRRKWEEEQAKKTVLETSVKGAVKWYSVLGHYGFISRGDGEKDVFVHQSAISQSRIKKYFLRTLGDGETVVFDIVDGQKGPEAANVTGPDGGHVVGSRFFRLQLASYRNARQKKDRLNGGERSGGQTADVQPIADAKSDEANVDVRKRSNRKRNADRKRGKGRKEVAGGRRRRATDEPVADDVKQAEEPVEDDVKQANEPVDGDVKQADKPAVDDVKQTDKPVEDCAKQSTDIDKHVNEQTTLVDDDEFAAGDSLGAAGMEAQLQLVN